MTSQSFRGRGTSQQVSATVSSEAFQDLCLRFLYDFARWVEIFPTTAVFEGKTTAELDSLEKSWSTALRRIENLTPMTLVEALRKFEVAQAYVSWCSPGDGRAADLLAAASASFHEFFVADSSRPRRPKPKSE